MGLNKNIKHFPNIKSGFGKIAIRTYISALSNNKILKCFKLETLLPHYYDAN